MADRLVAAVFAHPRAAHQQLWCGAFADGLVRHGVHVVRCTQREFPPPADVAVFWSYRHKSVIAAQRQSGGRCVVLERNFFGPELSMASAGWDGLNGRADFCNVGSRGDRHARYGPELQPWRLGGDYVLLMGQVPGDMSHAHADLNAWYAMAIEEIRAVWDGPLYFRPHPKGSQAPDLPVMDGALEDGLAGAAYVVTFNSNSAVDAVIAGVPAVTYDEGSMAWDVTAHTPGQHITDRTQWARDLAYCQWTETEFSSGETWEHLKHAIESDNRAVG